MIGDAISAALPLLRAHAESLMIERCDIERESSTWSEDLQKTVVSWVPVAMSVPCYTGGSSGGPRSLAAGEAVTPDSPSVHAPHTLAGVEPDDRVTVSSGAVLWVSHVPIDPYPVEALLECRWLR